MVRFTPGLKDGPDTVQKRKMSVPCLPISERLPILILSVIIEETFLSPTFTGLHVKKGKAVPLQACSGPEGSRKFRFPDFMTMAQDGGKVVSLTHRPPLPPSKYYWYSFLLEAESTPGP